ncbi:GNAT family N-acetyltransferase [Streptomyces malaysiensis subsp. malaysiensis]|uniref:GNAT family N-acetyltransferase n=1 Tax=Streptomyces malaysiensis TaxID=92644 RepID=A0ABX6W5T3_STRMQ|nr:MULTISPECIES: GNAT family N-acetyltransferase [Streptomyces]QPI56000.1 GNAT family N-acetyltransferase [Streptomyces solisilvae]UHH17470.1 GNAT family N-acetyltransferase [Streptomyces sp. HNM0561]
MTSTPFAQAGSSGDAYPTYPPYPASPASPAWTVAARPVDDPVSAVLLREYLVDVADRYYQLHEGRDSTREEIEQAHAEMPSDDLAPPGGVFLLAHHDGELAGCAGLRLLDAHTAELKRVFVRPAKRGLGGGAALLAAVEAAAGALGAGRIVLDTRRDLAEARALYARHGYREVPAFTEGPYAEVWMGKELG